MPFNISPGIGITEWSVTYFFNYDYIKECADKIYEENKDYCSYEWVLARCAWLRGDKTAKDVFCDYY